jgi:hypothetical protein
MDEKRALTLCSFHRNGVEREGPTFVRKNFGRPKLLLSELQQGFRCLGATICQAGEKSYNECSRWNSWILPWNVLLLLTIFVKLRNLQPRCDRRGGAVLQGQGDSWVSWHDQPNKSGVMIKLMNKSIFGTIGNNWAMDLDCSPSTSMHAGCSQQLKWSLRSGCKLKESKGY